MQATVFSVCSAETEKMPGTNSGGYAAKKPKNVIRMFFRRIFVRLSVRRVVICSRLAFCQREVLNNKILN
jgi:hypothetical protein